MLMTRCLLAAFILLCGAGCRHETNAVAPAAGAKSARAVATPSSPERAAPVEVEQATAARFDPDLMRVTLFGDRLLIEDPGHAWPAYLDKASMAFVRDGMAKFGAPTESDAPADCPGGNLHFLSYPNGLQLAFRDDTLVGYWASEGARSVATAAGVQPGSPRSALGGAELVEASFGWVADLEGVIALLDDKQSRVTDLYAGAACIYD